jgi:hypothetical protein
MYKVKENEVASTLKYLASDELGKGEWDNRNGKICRLFGGIF